MLWHMNTETCAYCGNSKEVDMAIGNHNFKKWNLDGTMLFEKFDSLDYENMTMSLVFVCFFHATIFL